MSGLSKMDCPSDPKAALLLKEKICDTFEEALLASQRPSLDDYLVKVDQEARPDLLRELLLIELHYLDHQGKTPDFDAYRRRYPLHLSVIEELFENTHLWRYPRNETIGAVLDTESQRLRAGESGRRMCVRCPHCREAMDVVSDAPLTGVVCDSCGSQFSLAGHEDQQATDALASIGHFELISRIGVGGFGTVWRAVDTTLDRVVAIKIPRSGQLDPNQELRLWNEARAAAQLSHPNIVSVHEVGRDGDTIYIVGDLVNGVTLSDWLVQRRPTQRESVEVCVKIASALEYAHEAGIVHRDVKASNILMDQTDEPRITDFGLAKRLAVEATIGEDGKVFGTPAYMAPEQARGEGHLADRRSDVYSLGVVLYQLLTEELPFRGNVGVLLHQVIHEEPPSPRRFNYHIPRDLETICLKCLEKDPGKRYSTAKQLAEDLRRFQRGEPIVARPISTAARAWRWCRRKPMTATAGALLAVIAVASPVIAVRERLHFLEAVELNQQRANAIQRLIEQRDELRQQLTVPAELRGYREHRQVSPARRKLMRLAYDHYRPAAEQMVGEATTPEERSLATLGLAILAMDAQPAAQAIALLLQARDDLEKAASESAEDHRLKAGLAYCYDSLSELYGNTGDPDLARKYCERAEQIWRQLAEAEPTLAIYHAMAENQFNATTWLELDASDADLALERFVNVAPRELKAFFPDGPRQLYETACELANCRPWLTLDKTVTREDTRERP